METLTSKERVFTALSRKEPDRVPILEWFIHPKIIDSILPGGSYEDFIEKIDLDGACASTYNYEVLDKNKVQIKKDVVFFDDGTTTVKRKEGTIKKIEDGFIYFSEYGHIQLIPVVRIIRIEKGEDSP